MCACAYLYVSLYIHLGTDTTRYATHACHAPLRLLYRIPFGCCDRQVGLMGIVEHEWLQTLAALDPASLHCAPFVDAARAIARELRVGCDMYIYVYIDIFM